MSAIEFGQVALCRTCHGSGQVRHHQDPDEARERKRRRRQGQDVPPPPSHDPCPTCHGKPILPAGIVDQTNESTLIVRRRAGEELPDGSRVLR